MMDTRHNRSNHDRSLDPIVLTFNTTNLKKTAEVNRILATVLCQDTLTIEPAQRKVEVSERQLNDHERALLKEEKYAEVAKAISLEKAFEARRCSGKPLLVEDTQLFFTALDGLPGPAIKDWAENRKLRASLCTMAHAHGNTRVTAVVTFALAHHNEVGECWQGVVHGACPNKPIGDNGFGWDDIFIPADQSALLLNTHERTYAQMTSEEKDLLSPRTAALKALIENASPEIST